MQRRVHYEAAFEHYLRANRAPYVAVDEARKALLPEDDPDGGVASLKSFDFVVYGAACNLLVDVKGRVYGRQPKAPASTGGRRFDSWVPRQDVDDLRRWQSLFGANFRAVFVFIFTLRQQPPDALFEEVFTFQDRWYALRQISLDAYAEAMVARSAKWGTVHLRAADFERLSRPFTVRQPENRAPGGPPGPRLRPHGGVPILRA